MKKIATFCIVVCLALAPMQASSYKVDSLKAALLQTQEPLQQGRLNYLIAYHLRQPQPTQALPFALQAIAHFKYVKDAGRTGKAYKLVGYVYHHLDSTQAAFESYLNAAAYLKKALDFKNLGLCYLDLALEALQVENTQMAQEYIDMAAHFLEGEASKEQLQNLLITQSRLLIDKTEYKKALLVLDKADSLKIENEALIYFKIKANLELNNVQYADVLLKKHFNPALINQNKHQARLLRVKAILQEYQGQYTAALNTLSLLKADTMQDRGIQAAWLFRQTSLRHKMGQPAQAAASAAQMVAWCQQHQLQNHLLNYLPMAASVAKSQQDYKTALYYQEQLNGLVMQLQVPQIQAVQQQSSALRISQQQFAAQQHAQKRIGNNEWHIRSLRNLLYTTLLIGFLILLLWAVRPRFYSKMIRYLRQAAKNDPQHADALIRMTYWEMRREFIMDPPPLTDADYYEQPPQENNEP